MGGFYWIWLIAHCSPLISRIDGRTGRRGGRMITYSIFILMMGGGGGSIRREVSVRRVTTVISSSAGLTPFHLLLHPPRFLYMDGKVAARLMKNGCILLKCQNWISNEKSAV